MIPIRMSSSIVLLGTALLASAPTAHGEEVGDGSRRVVRIVDRCEVYGPGFTDLGNGTCGQVIISGRVRVEAAGQPPSIWSTNGTANAALRSDGLRMLPGAAGAQHLRVQSGNDPYGR